MLNTTTNFSTMRGFPKRRSAFIFWSLVKYPKLQPFSITSVHPDVLTIYSFRYYIITFVSLYICFTLPLVLPRGVLKGKRMKVIERVRSDSIKCKIMHEALSQMLSMLSEFSHFLETKLL